MANTNQNKINKLFFIRFFTIILALILTMLLINITSIKFEQISVKYAGNLTNISKFPFSEVTPAVGDNFTVTAYVVYHWYSQDYVKLFIDDCIISIAIDGNPVSFPELDEQKLCLNANGHNINLGKFLSPGGNHFVFTVKDFGGQYSFLITNSIKSKISILLLCMATVLFLALGLLMLRYSKINKILIMILLIGIILRVAFFGDVFYGVRAPDAESHLQYIRLISESNWLPDANACFGCYSPPLYHILSAIAYSFAKFANFQDPVLMIYALSLFFSIITLVYIYRILLLFLKRMTFTTYLIFISACVWPSLILYSVAINNDSLSFMLIAMGLYYLLSYSIGRRFPEIATAILVTSLAILTKLSAGALALAIIGYLTFMSFQGGKKRQLHLFLLLVSIAIFLISAIPAIARNYSIEESPNDIKNLLVGNSIWLSDSLRVNNTIEALLYFDAHSYLKYPFLYGPYLNPEINYYPNFLLKTAVVGEFAFDNKYKGWAASVLDITLLILIASISIGLIITFRPNASHPVIIMLIFFISSILLHLILRLTSPYSCSQNARYILLAIVPGLILIYYSMEYLKTKKIFLVSLILYITLILFVIAAIFLLAPFGS